MKNAIITSAAAALAGIASAQPHHADHNHLSINTDGTNTIIEVGYLADETDFGLNGDGYVTNDGHIFVYHLDTFGHGYYSNLAAVLTSDFFAATGNLDGGDFNYEIVDFAAVDGGAATEAAWGHEAHHGGGGLNILASSNGATRLERSLNVGVGGHIHEQRAAVDALGIYDITLVAWDANGVYGDSQAVTLRVNAIPAPASAALLGLAGIAATRRRR